jgi:hypothetical protein
MRALLLASTVISGSAAVPPTLEDLPVKEISYS